MSGHECYSFHAGTLPLLISVPHDGRQIPDDIIANMTDVARSLPDTDWHVARLYEFAIEFGASIITANYSRYVVDLNRPADDSEMYAGQLATGLCPAKTFGGEDLYGDTESIDTDARVDRYWRPYHDKIAVTLADIRAMFGYALLWDAHSIASRVPSLFDGILPVLNFGTWNGRSCDQGIADAVMRIGESSTYETVLNARFKGGHITRRHGRPDTNVHAVQLEIAQRAYMNEVTTDYDERKASQLRDTLSVMLDTFAKTAGNNVGIMRR